MKNFIKQTSILSVAITIAFVVYMGVQIVQGAGTWNPPGCDPTAVGGPGACNAPEPINVSTSAQKFLGSKTIDVNNITTDIFRINSMFRVDYLSYFADKVGIGTASPQSLFHINDTTQTHKPSILVERDSNAQYSPRIGFVDTNVSPNTVAGSPMWGIDNLNDQLRIFRQTNISTGGDDRWNTHLKILNDGRVGIGNNGPAWMLDVQSENGSRINLEQVTNAAVPSLIKRIAMRLDGGAVDLGWSGADLYIAAMGENRNVLINPSGGDVGIGDDSPDGDLKLDVNGKVGATQYCDENGNNCKAITAMGGGNFGGMFSIGGCPTEEIGSPNPYTGSYSCPPGFNQSRLDGIEMACRGEESGVYQCWK